MLYTYQGENCDISDGESKEYGYVPGWRGYSGRNPGMKKEDMMNFLLSCVY